MTLKTLFSLVLFIFSIFNTSIASEYSDVTEKVFKNRKLDSIEGIWIKTVANEGPTGCVTMFYKDEDDFYYQIHVKSCFVIGKITGKQNKISENEYNGENAVYFFNGDVNWGKSFITISENLNTISITHNSYGNIFREEWKRVWPKNISQYNENIKNKQ